MSYCLSQLHLLFILGDVGKLSRKFPVIEYMFHRWQLICSNCVNVLTTNVCPLFIESDTELYTYHNICIASILTWAKPRIRYVEQNEVILIHIRDMCKCKIFLNNPTKYLYRKINFTLKIFYEKGYWLGPCFTVCTPKFSMLCSGYWLGPCFSVCTPKFSMLCSGYCCLSYGCFLLFLWAWMSI